jgi:hypothetical protein
MNYEFGIMNFHRRAAEAQRKALSFSNLSASAPLR